MEFDEHFLCFKMDYAFTLKTGICAFHSENFFAFLPSLDQASHPEFCGWGKKANYIYSTKDHLLRVIVLHTCFSFSSCSLSTH